jgi:hypothetical protein
MIEQNNQQQRCECHDCTQARWRMSLQGQIEAAIHPNYVFIGNTTVDSTVPPLAEPAG